MTEQVKMSDKFFVYQPYGEGCGDFVAFNGAYGESILDEAECVKMLNGFNNTCIKQEWQIKMLREALEKCITCSDSLDFEAGWMDSAIDAADKALSATEQK